MAGENYLEWLVKNTRTTWWNDGANADELRKAIENGATGVTSNPFLVNQAIQNTANPWFDEARKVAAAAAGPAERAEIGAPNGGRVSVGESGDQVVRRVLDDGVQAAGPVTGPLEAVGGDDPEPGAAAVLLVGGAPP